MPENNTWNATTRESGSFWKYFRYILLAIFSAVIVVGIVWIYRDYHKVQSGASLSASEKAYDIKGEYLYDKSVLVISSYSPTYMIVPEEEDGIYDTLKAARIGYEIDYMNYKELGTGEDYEETFYTSLKAHLDYHQNAGTTFSAIMAGDDDALRFCMKYREELFPELPIVFYAVNDIAYAQECAADPLVTGSVEKTYLMETIALAQRLVPNANEFVLIRDNTPTCNGDWANLQNISRYYPSMTVSDINTETMSTQEFCDRIGQLSDRAIVLCSVALRDHEGHVLPLMKRFNLIGEYANVPVFSCYMHGIGNGATAGDAMYMRDCGETAARQIVQILNDGADPATMSLKAEGFHRIAIDETMMAKHHLKLKNLPSDALILNQAPSFWNTYREIVIPLMMIIGSLLGILLLLVIDGFYVRKAKRHVDHQNHILDAISHEFISLWYIDPKDHSCQLIRDHSDSQMTRSSTSDMEK